MIPLKLELKNFLSYGEPLQTIDFKDYSLICLSGKNGNGKSALLDAITWAVWGQARKIGGISKADEGLLRLGQTRMIVILTFMLNKKIFRVRREFAKTYGKPHAALDFEIFDDGINGFKSLTDKTIRATQEKIENTINIDFETFINSAFLKQGQSNEFSKKTAKERKQILANILGLTKYDLLQQQANADARKLELEQSSQKHSLSLMENEINQEADFHMLLEELNQKVLSISQDILTKQQFITQQEKLLHQQEEQEKLRLFLITELENLSLKNNDATLQFKKTRQEWLELSHIKKSLPTPEELILHKNKLIAQKKEHEELTLQLSLLEKNLASLNQSLQNERFSREKEILQNIQQTTLSIEKINIEKQSLTQQELQNKQDLLDLEKKLTIIQKVIQDHEKKIREEALFQQTWQTTKNQFEKRRAYYQRLVQLGNQVTNKKIELASKKTLLTHQPQAQCPLCDQPLNEKAHKQVVQDLTNEEIFLDNRLIRISTLLKKLKEILVNQHNEYNKLEKQSLNYAQIHATLLEKKSQEQDLLTQKLLLTQTSLEAKIKISKLESELNNTEIIIKRQKEELVSIDSSTNIIELHKNINLTNNQILKYKNQSASFPNTQKMLEELEILQAASTNQLNLEQKISGFREKSYELLKTLKDIKKQSASYLTTLKNIKVINAEELSNTLKNFFHEKTLLETQKTELSLEQGKIKNSLERITTLKKDHTAKIDSINKLQIEIDDLIALSLAFGKNGIQALLIEDAIPEIEQEANNLLSKLTDNQAQIFIESLRDLKNGGVKETLEIKVSDAAGIRPYEMFSGGEAFRIDFALRIAISKLLARRAGTALQTLIIDEGFGSQDEEGLNRIMNSLLAIQNDFSKIIVVSHLNEFKENFPIHFIVEKTANGSYVKIEERG